MGPPQTPPPRRAGLPTGGREGGRKGGRAEERAAGRSAAQLCQVRPRGRSSIVSRGPTRPGVSHLPPGAAGGPRQAKPTHLHLDVTPGQAGGARRPRPRGLAGVGARWQRRRGRLVRLRRRRLPGGHDPRREETALRRSSGWRPAGCALRAGAGGSRDPGGERGRSGGGLRFPERGGGGSEARPGPSRREPPTSARAAPRARARETSPSRGGDGGEQAARAAAGGGAEGPARSRSSRDGALWDPPGSRRACGSP